MTQKERQLRGVGKLRRIAKTAVLIIDVGHEAARGSRNHSLGQHRTRSGCLQSLRDLAENVLRRGNNLILIFPVGLGDLGNEAPE